MLIVLLHDVFSTVGLISSTLTNYKPYTNLSKLGVSVTISSRAYNVTRPCIYADIPF